MEQRLTVLKEYMTLNDMKEYFDFKDGKTFEKWERQGLKTIKLTRRTKFYKADDIREFLDKTIESILSMWIKL